MTKYANIGLLFNKHYFREIRYTDPNNENFDYKKDAYNRAVVSGNNKMLFNSSLNNSPLNLGNCHFELKTIYPGLFLGSGYPHEAGIEGELKLGFFFDYSTGIPILPGSSVKGVLRNAFEVANGGYLKELLENKLKLETWKVENLLDRKIKVEGIKEKIPYIVASIFHGYYPVAEADKIIYKQAGVYQRDIFFDAVPVGKVAEGKFLANDFITPHKDNEGNFNPLKDPVPLQFLKILPGITFHFDFKLHNTLDENGKDLLTASQKKDLFRFILEDLGIGAKTNVGYGQFEKPLIESGASESSGQSSSQPQQPKSVYTPPPPPPSSEEDKIIKIGAKLQAEVINEDRKYYYFQFDFGKKLKFKKKKTKLNAELKVGQKVKIEITSDYAKSKSVDFKNSIEIIS